MFGISKILLNFKKDSICESLYLIAIFLLVSAPSISSLILVFILSLNIETSINILKQNRTNYLLILISFFMILSCIDKSINSQTLLKETEPFLTWISLINWIPLFLFFGGSQIFLNTQRKREKTMQAICFGTIPLISSGIAQYFFNWTGPYKFLNGMIIWYQRPILGEAGVFANGISGLTGLFNNANTAADWLLIVLPMQIYFLIRKNSSSHERIFFFILTALSTLSLVLTNSRSALIGLTSIITFIFNIKLIFFLVSFLFLTIYVSSSFNIVYLKNIFSFLKVEYIKSIFLSLVTDPRISIWNNTLDFIFTRPIFGYGAASIPILFNLNNLGMIFHAHNIFGELAIVYGLPSAILIIFFITKIFFNAFKVYSVKEFVSKKLKDLDNTWILSSLLIIYTQIIDFTYYDYRISIIFWTLLSGLVNIKNSEKILY
jgi:O-antigen ligase